jgi:m7GpppX diphosphatase
MKIEYLLNNKKCTFIFDETSIAQHVTVYDKKMENDDYLKFSAKLDIPGEVIISNDRLKNDNSVHIVGESYEEYLKFISVGLFKKDIWIYNIIDGIAETENTIYKDDKILIAPNFIWNKKDTNKFYLLVIPYDKNLRTLRSLNNSHLELLEHMQQKIKDICESYYNIKMNMTKMFFHYPPSTHHLHLHVSTINNPDCHSSIEYSHEFTQVIKNIKLKKDYYQNDSMNVIKSAK